MSNQLLSSSYLPSSLITGLQSLALMDAKVPHKQFVATVGQFIDFGEAFGLADFLAKLPHLSARADGEVPVSDRASSKEQLASYYAAEREKIALAIQKSLSNLAAKQPKQSLSSPLAGSEAADTTDNQRQAYQRFYALQQSEIESRVVALHRQVGYQLTGCSSRLAQLVALDNKLGDILVNYSRKAFAQVQQLIVKRFSYWVSQSADSTLDTSSQTSLIAEMQMLLLAELEVRLQPTLGLVEAMIKEEKQVV